MDQAACKFQIKFEKTYYEYSGIILWIRRLVNSKSSSRKRTFSCEKKKNPTKNPLT